MKKEYILPEIEWKALKTGDIICSSPLVEGSEYSGEDIELP